MEGIAEHRESFSAQDIARDDDLGLTLPPGSQSPTDSLFGEEDMDGFEFSHDPDLDHSEELHETVHELDGSQKRTSDDAFVNEPSHSAAPAAKKPNLVVRGYPSIAEELLGVNCGSQASISSHSLASLSTCSASAVAQNRFSLGQEDLAHHMAVEELSRGKSDVKHVSPYGLVGYRPSAPSLHSRLADVSSETLRNRLSNSRRRVNVLTVERNRYRDALLKYTSVDPETGKLGIHALESELSTLRRVCSTQQQRAKKHKADIAEWMGKYVNVARAHNSLIRDYQSLSHRQPSTEVEIVSGEDEWESRYSQLGRVFNDLLAAYLLLQHSQGINTSLPPVPPFSLPSPPSSRPSPAPSAPPSAPTLGATTVAPSASSSVPSSTPPSATTAVAPSASSSVPSSTPPSATTAVAPSASISAPASVPASVPPSAATAVAPSASSPVPASVPPSTASSVEPSATTSASPSEASSPPTIDLTEDTEMFSANLSGSSMEPVPTMFGFPAAKNANRSYGWHLPNSPGQGMNFQDNVNFGLNTQGYATPDINAPGFAGPSYVDPSYNTPVYNAPGYATPGLKAQAYSTPALNAPSYCGQVLNTPTPGYNAGASPTNLAALDFTALDSYLSSNLALPQGNPPIATGNTEPLTAAANVIAPKVNSIAANANFIAPNVNYIVPNNNFIAPNANFIAPKAKSPVAKAKPRAQKVKSLATKAQVPTITTEPSDVIDLTNDPEPTVCTPASNALGSQDSTTEANPLTTFHREFRKKKLDWLKDNTPNDHDATTQIFDAMNPQIKKNVVNLSIAECFNLVQTQKQVRRSLGGGFAACVPEHKAGDDRAPDAPAAEDCGEQDDLTEEQILEMMHNELGS